MDKPYYYNAQFRRYIIQFMNVFAGLQVQVGKSATEAERLINLDVYYGNRDRVTAAILAENTQNKPIRLPCLSVYLKDVSPAPDMRHGIDIVRTQSYLKRGGIFPNDIKTVEQLMPIPYWLTFEAQIYASNTDQHFQVLEQILMLFNPSVQLQTTDAIFDWTKIFTVELTGIRNEENYPPGAAARIIQTGLDFRTLAYVSAPANIRDNYIKDIWLRIGLMNQAIETAESSGDILAALDQEGAIYQLLLSGENAKIT